ncbi:MAG: FAD-dependent thymidylate synthase [Candidatus Pacearchaeota archaeon]
MKVIEPRVKLVDYGPKRIFENYKKGESEIITPDEIVASAAGITYKDTKYFSEAILRRINEDFGNITKEGYRKDLIGLINSVGEGHASLSTTPYIWISIEGNSSKMIDSLFTSARFGSFLMPSSRRIPIEKENIVIPREIQERGEEASEIYKRVSEKNIEAYERLQNLGIHKEEAAKIVQYGHLGGGFLSFSLETLVGWRKEFERNKEHIPKEGIDIIKEIEEIIKQKGMTICYTARLLSPREPYINPTIFHNEENEAELTFLREIPSSFILNSNNLEMEFLRRIRELRKEILSTYTNEEKIEENWREISGKLQQICNDFPNAIDITIASLVPWRVWGELKRHRTLMQSAQSIYKAADEAVKKLKDEEGIEYKLEEIFSFRPVIRNNEEAKRIWIERIKDSMNSYERLIKEFGVPKSEAIYIVPRGLKIKVLKKFDTWNVLQGYIPLRLCQTAEGEMREITEADAEIIRSNLPLEVCDFVQPKCYITGHCHDGIKGKSCGKIKKRYSFYEEEFDKRIKEKRKEEIKREIESKEDKDS